jgi:hypothetical protein
VGSSTAVNILVSQKCARVLDVPQTWFINWPDDGSMSRNIYENNQQDALYRLIYYSKSALHISYDVFAHHQEHLTVFTVSGYIHG